MQEIESGLSRAEILKMSYNVRSVHQKIPFEYRQAMAGSDGVADRRTTERQEDRPVLVDTGKMAIVDKDIEVLSDGFLGCVALFIEGSAANSLTHMVSGNNHRNFGYWEEKGCNPLPETGEKIQAVLSLLGEADKNRALVLANGKCVGKKKHLLALKKRLQEIGIKQVRIVEVPPECSMVYYSPNKANSIKVIGDQKNPDGSKGVKDYTVDLAGEDVFINE